MPVRLERKRGAVVEFCEMIPRGPKLLLRSGANGKVKRWRTIECWAGVTLPGKLKKRWLQVRSEGSA